MSSWYDAWAHRYADWTVGITADVPFYAALAREADGPLVELAVGDGRVAIPVAQATGRRVIGIDASPAMLAQARVRAAEEGVQLDLREGDMREFELDEPAALIYCPGRSLLHLPTWADRRRCFERVAVSLRPGGRFAKRRGGARGLQAHGRLPLRRLPRSATASRAPCPATSSEANAGFSFVLQD